MWLCAESMLGLMIMIMIKDDRKSLRRVRRRFLYYAQSQPVILDALS